MHFVYILYSEKIDRYYIGSTSMPVEERLKKHLGSHKGFTSRANDWEIVYVETFDTVTQARKRESQIKSWKSRKAMEKLIYG